VTKETIIGTRVVVEGDRGVDLGCIIAVERSPTADPAAAVAHISEEKEKGRKQPKALQLVLRSATCGEIADDECLEADEVEATAYAQAQARRLLGSKLAIKAATFQFDRQKLTLHYTAAERVYFVPLLKSLNQRYHCRIWMEQLGGAERSDANEKDE